MMNMHQAFKPLITNVSPLLTWKITLQESFFWNYDSIYCNYIIHFSIVYICIVSLLFWFPMIPVTWHIFKIITLLIQETWLWSLWKIMYESTNITKKWKFLCFPFILHIHENNALGVTYTSTALEESCWSLCTSTKMPHSSQCVIFKELQ